MYKVLALAAVALCAGCAGQEVNPDASKTRLADDPYCLHQTGSYIRRGESDCVPSSGRVFSREQLERTGRPGTGDALKALLPR